MLTSMPDVVALIAAVVVGVIVVYAGATKLVSGGAWHESVASADLPRVVLRGLPILEVTLGSLTVVRLWLPVVPLMLVGLLVLFTLWIVSAMRREVVPPCACFGSRASEPVGWKHVGRNVALLALACIAAFG
jgi:uncharacterized membrane protein YphA (DoxX/SURF4 family)